ncbi:MAG: hypothetical protein BGO98_07305 [Myxococcales bacterium 68-20]|nr:hypothetical protein [Myxococcales bacterium]OJY26801.1 MAG: hypothetical protein BGO98_07305 [Myxococcales bacterium 68-20]
MYRTLNIIFAFSFVGAAAVACGGTSNPAPTGGVHASSSPASADEAASSASDAEQAAVSAGEPLSGSTYASASTSSTDEPRDPNADPCDGTQCPEDQFCDLQSVRCVRAPCPAVPTCISGMNPCAATSCIYGSRCESHDGQAACVPMTAEGGGTPCGRSSCEPGMVCCNASCGICTPPDGACTQQACE